jgi:hypothetical protein
MLPPSISERMRQEVAEIIASWSKEDRERFRSTPEKDLILFHHGLGMGLRNGFRQNRFHGLFTFCHKTLKQSGKPTSFDALSEIAIREIWSTLQVPQ